VRRTLENWERKNKKRGKICVYKDELLNTSYFIFFFDVVECVGVVVGSHCFETDKKHVEYIANVASTLTTTVSIKLLHVFLESFTLIDVYYTFLLGHYNAVVCKDY